MKEGAEDRQTLRLLLYKNEFKAITKNWKITECDMGKFCTHLWATNPIIRSL
jgi:hypothetical protein